MATDTFDRTDDDEAQAEASSQSAAPVRKEIGLKEIAQHAGVSVSTVSMSLSDHPHIKSETKQRIREISRQLGYRRLRRAPRQSHGSTGNGGAKQRFGFLLMGSRMDDAQKLQTLRALTLSASKLHIRMEVQAIEDMRDAGHLTDQILQYARNLDGVIVSDMVDMTVLAGLESAEVPHVILGHLMAELHEVPGHRGQIVTADDVGMGRLATSTLLDNGHRRIAFICERIPKGLWTANWLRGYHIALAEANHAPDPKLVYVAGKAFADTAPAAQAMASLPERQRPSAYIVPDARLAAAFLKSMRERGGATVVPRESIVISGLRHEVQRFELGDYPWIGYDLDQVAAVAVRQLSQLCNSPMPCASQLTVPLISANLPPRPKATAKA